MEWLGKQKCGKATLTVSPIRSRSDFFKSSLVDFRKDSTKSLNRRTFGKSGTDVFYNFIWNHDIV